MLGIAVVLSVTNERISEMRWLIIIPMALGPAFWWVIAALGCAFSLGVLLGASVV